MVMLVGDYQHAIHHSSSLDDPTDLSVAIAWPIGKGLRCPPLASGPIGQTSAVARRGTHGVHLDEPLPSEGGFFLEQHCQRTRTTTGYEHDWNDVIKSLRI
jgi:hypothetical protein